MTFEVEQSVTRIRTRLVLEAPWWSALALRLEQVILKDGEIPRCTVAATDGNRLFIRPEGWLPLTPDEQLGVMVHEALHCGLLHHARRNDRDPQGWNIATDFAVNLICTEYGLTLPKDCLLDQKYAGMTAEQIYEQLPEPLKNSPRCGFGVILDGDASQASIKEWQQAAAAAMQAAALAGKDPGSMERALQEASKPVIPWRELLAHHVSKCAGGEDYTWKRPSRRGLVNDLYLPSMYAENCRPIAIVIDTSGSMDEKTLTEAVREARSAIETLRPVETVIIHSDAAVQEVEILEPHQEFKPHSLKGGGGTDFRPGLTEAEKYDPVCIVYFTDLQGTFPSREPDVETIWVTKMHERAPFGVTICVE